MKIWQKKNGSVAVYWSEQCCVFCVYCCLPQAYDETGEVFPIWGECLGLELVAMIVSGRDLSLGQYDQSFLSLTDARNISLKLDLPSGIEKMLYHTHS